MISFPYPKLLNANDRVDQGAALILCSVEAARSAGVPEDRWVFPLSGADAHDHWFLSHRRDLSSSPAIRLAGERALRLAGLGIDDVAHIDLYSCFPCAVQIAANELGLSTTDPGRPLTVTGGLGFAGGPGNNYVTHSIATMADRLRRHPGSVGLVTGLGWYVTKHAVGTWSTVPPTHGFAFDSPQDEVDGLPQRVPASDYEGDAVVETYTVIHGARRPTRAGHRGFAHERRRPRLGNSDRPRHALRTGNRRRMRTTGPGPGRRTRRAALTRPLFRWWSSGGRHQFVRTALSMSDQGTAPSLRQRGVDPVTSTTVEASPSQMPPSTTTATPSPNASTSAAAVVIGA